MAPGVLPGGPRPGAFVGVTQFRLIEQVPLEFDVIALVQCGKPVDRYRSEPHETATGDIVTVDDTLHALEIPTADHSSTHHQLSISHIPRYRTFLVVSVTEQDSLAEQVEASPAVHLPLGVSMRLT